MAKSVYKSPQAGQPLITSISSGCKTPVLKVKFSNLINPFYYPNSPKVARYSITCCVIPKKHKEFLEGLESIEKNEKVESVLKIETRKEASEIVQTGNYLIKFQGKEKIPVYFKNTKDEIELEDELAQDEDVIVIYEILRYTKKNTKDVQHGLSFKPLCIQLYPKE